VTGDDHLDTWLGVLRWQSYDKALAAVTLGRGRP